VGGAAEAIDGIATRAVSRVWFGSASDTTTAVLSNTSEGAWAITARVEELDW
jgi:hypothetical protein